MIKTGDKEKDYLLYLIRATLKKEEPQPPEEEINTARLLALAVKQQVYTVVLPYIEAVGILSPEALKKWNDYKLNEIRKSLLVSSARNELMDALEEREVKYIFIKGLVIRDYYPQSIMRQMSDNDILYDYNKRDVLFEIMKEQGYYLAGTQETSDDFFKAPFASMEMHKKLFVINNGEPVYLDLWQRAVKDENYEYKYNISPDDNYIYSLTHMYRHYSSKGCGIRFLCDTYVLLHSDDELDFDYINSKFSELGILDFYNRVIHLVDAVFDDAEYDNDDLTLLTEVFAGGVFGMLETIQDDIENKGGKFLFILKKIFPPVEFMKRNFEILQKKPYLLPIYYIRHFIARYKNKGDKAKKDLKYVLKS